MFVPIFKMGNMYNTGLHYFGAFKLFDFGSLAPKIFSYPLMPNFSAPSIFSYMSTSSLPNIENMTNYIYLSSNSLYKPAKFYTPVSRGEKIGKNQNASAWKNLGYCAEAGVKLAKTALNSAVGFIGYCARYVKNAIAKCGLGKYVSGDAHNLVSVMRKNKKFKEINVSGVNVKKLPAGTVVVYGKGVSGYSSKYGHVEIATGDGRCVSDGITRNPRSNPTAIFIPIAS